MEQNNIFRSFAVNQALGFSAGWLFHGVLSHAFTGEHGLSLTIPQLAMHNVSLTGMILILVAFQSRATKQLFGFNLMKYWPIYTLLHLGCFWAGYYLLGAPMDIVLSFIVISVLNGLYITKAIGLRRWTLYSILSSIVGLVVGTAIIMMVEPVVLRHFTGLARHTIVFLLEGSAVGIPMAIFGGAMLRRVVARSNSATIALRH